MGGGSKTFRILVWAQIHMEASPETNFQFQRLVFTFQKLYNILSPKTHILVFIVLLEKRLVHITVTCESFLSFSHLHFNVFSHQITLTQHFSSALLVRSVSGFHLFFLLKLVSLNLGNTEKFLCNFDLSSLAKTSFCM